MSARVEPAEREMTSLQVSERVAQHLESLSLPVDDLNGRMLALLEAEYRRRLSRYSLTDRLMTQKYGMSFNEFEKQKVTEQQDYTWEVESDAIEWDLAVSGIRTMRRKLSELLES